MNKTSLHRWFASFVLVVLAFAGAGAAWADPPSRVVRLAYTSGAVSFSPGGENDWVRATVNRPLITGDRLWADAAARAELHLGGTAMHMGQNTSVTLLNLDDRLAQLQLAQGTLNLRVRHLDRDHAIEVDTPNLAYSVRRPGSYRIEVEPDGSSTTITVRSGEGEVFGEGNAFIVAAGQTYRFYGTDLRDYENYALSQPDEFDRWSADRDRRWERSVSARYVSPDMIGYEDLDEYGTWRDAQGYGPVWVPTRVASDWAPYRDGHWAWVEPWGWTWVDDAPWGFAPSHYGRWARIDNNWAWVPGPAQERPVYAPAVVQFVGNSSSSNTRELLTVAGIAAVAWFALAPHEVYQPSYPVSRDYLTAVNRSNTVVNTTNITNVYNTTNVTNVVYANRQVPGAVVAVPTATFSQSKPVAAQTLRVTQETVARAPVVAVASIAPAHTSVLGAAAVASAKPPAMAVSRPVVAKTAPPPAPVPFAARQQLLAANPGKPPDPAAVARLKPAAPATATTTATPAAPVAPAVRVVTAAPKPAPLPPRPASAAPAERPRAEAAAAPAASRPAAPAPVARTEAPSAPKAVEPAPPRTAAAAPRPPVASQPAASAAMPPLPQSTNAFMAPHASAPSQAAPPRARAQPASQPEAPPRPQAQARPQPEEQPRPQAQERPKPEAPPPRPQAQEHPKPDAVPHPQAQERPKPEAVPRPQAQEHPKQEAVPHPPTQERAQPAQERASGPRKAASEAHGKDERERREP